MPIYTYKCNSCDCVFDSMNTIDNRHEANCPECGHKGTQKITAARLKLPFDDPSGFPTSYDAWERKRNQKMAQEKKQES